MTDHIQAINAAEELIQDAYWALCDSLEEAADPADLHISTAVCELLQEAYYNALKVEAIANENGLPWSEARGFL